MGTNYYVSTAPCEHCGVSKYDNLHIGKSSAGWAFMLHVYPALGISSFRDWMKILSADKTIIRDEYDNYVSFSEMVQCIVSRINLFPMTDAKARLEGYMDLQTFLDRNGAELDEEYGLLRARVDGTHCIKRGSGPYDYFVGDFS